MRARFEPLRRSPFVPDLDCLRSVAATALKLGRLTSVERGGLAIRSIQKVRIKFSLKNVFWWMTKRFKYLPNLVLFSRRTCVFRLSSKHTVAGKKHFRAPVSTGSGKNQPNIYHFSCAEISADGAEPLGAQDGVFSSRAALPGDGSVSVTIRVVTAPI